MTVVRNSITSHITPSDVANEARMKRGPAERNAGKKLAIAIVEGSTDQLMYSTILDTAKCLIITAHGKQNVIQALKILIEAKLPGVVGLVDDDFDSLEGIHLRSAYLCVSDTHDLETLLFAASSLDKLLTILLLPEKRMYLIELRDNVREKLLNLGSSIGYIRWFFRRENLLLDFQNVAFREFIDRQQLTVNFDACLDEILARNGGCRISKDEIKQKLLELRKISPNRWSLCQGHDLIKIFSLIINKLLSNYSPTNKDEKDNYFEHIQQKIPSEERITEQLIIGYEQDEFRKTIMHSDLLQWETQNPPYKVLRT